MPVNGQTDANCSLVADTAHKTPWARDFRVTLCLAGLNNLAINLGHDMCCPKELIDGIQRGTKQSSSRVDRKPSAANLINFRVSHLANSPVTGTTVSSPTSPAHDKKPP